MARRKTRYAAFGRCARAVAASQSTKRAARAAMNPALLGASINSRRSPRQHSPLRRRGWRPTRTPWWRMSGRRCPLQALSWGAEQRRLEGGARSALRGLTHGNCSSAVSEANAASFAVRPRGEQRRGVGPQGRPPHPSAGKGHRLPRRAVHRARANPKPNDRQEPPADTPTPPDTFPAPGCYGPRSSAACGRRRPWSRRAPCAGSAAPS